MYKEIGREIADDCSIITFFVFPAPLANMVEVLKKTGNEAKELISKVSIFFNFQNCNCHLFKMQILGIYIV